MRTSTDSDEGRMARGRRWLGRAAIGTAVLLFAVLRPGPARATISSPAALLRIALLVAGFVLLAFLLERFVPQPLVRAVVLAVPAATLAYFVVLPYFDDDRVEEALPASAAELDAGVAPATAAPAQTPTTTAAAPAADPAPPTEAPAPAGDAAPATETTASAATTTVAAATPTGPTLLTSGALVGIDHSATGTAAVYALADGTHIVRLEEIDVQSGPDYLLYAMPGADRQDPDGGIELGALKGNQGSQNYELPTDFDPSGEYTILIWCRAFAVPVANATQLAV